MRLAMSFSIANETPSISRRMRKEDEKLKDAIEKHYMKLVTMERNFKYESFKFSSTMTDLMTALGF